MHPTKVTKKEVFKVAWHLFKPQLVTLNKVLLNSNSIFLTYSKRSLGGDGKMAVIGTRQYDGGI